MVFASLAINVPTVCRFQRFHLFIVKTFALCSLVLVILFNILGFSLLSTNSGIGSSLEVTESHECSLGYGLTAICGTVVNNSSRNISYVLC